jgi:hypothetical protein
MAPVSIEACFDRVRAQLRKAPSLFARLPHSAHVARLWALYQRGEMLSSHEDYAFFVFLERVWRSKGNEGSDRVTLPETEAAGVTVWLRDGWLELRTSTAGESRALLEERVLPCMARIAELTAGDPRLFN